MFLLARMASPKADAEYKWHSLQICGIFAHVKDRGTAFIGLPAIAIAAETLDQAQEQDEVLMILSKIQQETGWRVDGWKARLKSQWETQSVLVEAQATASKGPSYSSSFSHKRKRLSVPPV